MIAYERFRRVYTVPKGRLGNRAQGFLLEASERVHVPYKLRHASRIVLVHTMGKVGSLALAAAIKDSGEPVVFHTHRLAGAEPDRRDLAPRRTWYTSRFLAKQLSSFDGQIIVITVARDPVDRNISGFFQNIDRYLDQSRRDHVRGVLPPVHELVDRFATRYPHRAVTTWFDREVEPLLGTELGSRPVDHSEGFWCYRRQNVTVYVLRYDHLGRAHDLLTSDFPTLRRLPVANSSSAKWYGPSKQVFEDRLTLSREVLDEIYGSAYSRRFWSETERRRAVERWSGPSCG